MHPKPSEHISRITDCVSQGILQWMLIPQSILPKHRCRRCVHSFESKWDFDITRDYLAGRSDAFAIHSAPKRRPGFKSNGIDRQVDFSLRYHQISMHKEATNATKRCETSSHSRQPSKRSYTLQLESNDIYKQRLMEVIKRRRRMSEQPMKDFKVNMHCSSKDDDRVQLAQDWLSRVDHPYKNPKPHDFRPDNIIILERKPKMRFLSTPDPGRIHFNSRYCHSQPSSVASTRRKSEADTFTTKMTPSTKYSNDLYFNKGHYSPAFSAYNAFLDRILKNIEH